MLTRIELARMSRLLFRAGDSVAGELVNPCAALRGDGTSPQTAAIGMRQDLQCLKLRVLSVDNYLVEPC